ncbi:hypothetical protein JVU11DRAFT_6271 [Chiua virens]|nr:hypothetical protein JVU11DRAFT_6271 [Chiua virens]
MAMFKQFGDPFHHEPRTTATMLAQLSVVKSKVDPNDIEAFFREAQRFCLNRVSELFWRNFPLSCPSFFITPELLHYLHKEFWDHDLQWCLNIIGEAEIDFRFSVLQPTAGSRHFKGSISKLKQVTGRVHCDVQCYLIAVIAGAAPPEVVVAICALMDFRYHVQAFSLFPLPLMFSMLISTPCLKTADDVAKAIGIKRVGVTIQWTVDTTEHPHVSEIKTPARSTNNNNYDPQICRYLDRAEKCRSFELATSLREQDAIRNQNTLLDGENSDEPSDVSDGEDDDRYNASQVSGLPGHARPSTNYFTISARLCGKQTGSVLLPLHSFIAGSMAVNLSYAPSLRQISVDEAAQKFGLPDLRAALADFLWHEEQYSEGFVHPIELQLWCKVWLQNEPIHGNPDVPPVQTLFCSPPTGLWALGHYDAAIFNVDAQCKWP